MNMLESVQVCFKKYADFEKRASREEYWWFFLFCALAGGIVSVYSEIVGNLTTIEVLVQLILLMPSLAVGVRRLHDTNKNGWNYLWGFTIIGIVALLIWFCEEGDKTKNRFGAKPTR